MSAEILREEGRACWRSKEDCVGGEEVTKPQVKRVPMIHTKKFGILQFFLEDSLQTCDG